MGPGEGSARCEREDLVVTGTHGTEAELRGTYMCPSTEEVEGDL